MWLGQRLGLGLGLRYIHFNSGYVCVSARVNVRVSVGVWVRVRVSVRVTVRVTVRVV